MKGFEELNTCTTAYELREFSGLCDRAKSYLFDWFLSCEFDTGYIDAIFNGGILDNQLTPIEQIFNVCYFRYIAEYISREVEIDGVPLAVILREEFAKQQEISLIINRWEHGGLLAETHTYIADFTIDFSRKKLDDEYLYPTLKSLKYVIELDGHEYHADKKKVNHDYEREQNLQERGYKVIRFTGSQVYNKPYSCIDKVIKIIVNDIKERAQNGSNKSS